MRCETNTDWRPALSQLGFIGLMEMIWTEEPIKAVTAAAMMAMVSGEIPSAAGAGDAVLDGGFIFGLEWDIAVFFRRTGLVFVHDATEGERKGVTRDCGVDHIGHHAV